MYIHFDTNVLKSVRQMQLGVGIILSLREVYKAVEKLPSFMLQFPGFLLFLCLNLKPYVFSQFGLDIVFTVGKAGKKLPCFFRTHIQGKKISSET